MIVKNINGISRHACHCASWLAHWALFAPGTLPARCAAVDCTKNAEVGAHVQKESGSDNKWYIAPFCVEHNNMKDQTLEVRILTYLAPANVATTCGV